MTVSAINYGPVTVVRDSESVRVYASTHGPGDLPLVLSASSSVSDGALVAMAASRAEVAWSEAGVGMPRELRTDFERVTVLDPLDLVRRNAPTSRRRRTAILEATKERRAE